MSLVSQFEPTFLAWLQARVADAAYKFYWARTPEGSPQAGVIEVTMWYVPGGDRQVTNSGMSGEEGRRIQFSIFSPDPQDVKNASKTLHRTLEGFSGDLGDDTHIWGIIPGSQDRDTYDTVEQVHQTDFDVIVRMTEGS